MLDPIFNFFGWLFRTLWQGLGLLVGALFAPFRWIGQWYAQRGWILKLVVGLVALAIVVMYALFFWNTQTWPGFNPNYVDAYEFKKRSISAGEAAGEGTAKVCGKSGIVEVAIDLTDYNVNQNAWISSTLAYKLGFFLVADWDDTPFFDNKASFQRGINQALRTTSLELVNHLGRVAATSQIDRDLESARGNYFFDEETWYFGIHPFGFKTPTPSYHRDAIGFLRAFNTRLENCSAVFDARSDNLRSYFTNIVSAMGDTSALLKDRVENHAGGVFDFRADDRFWFAYGQMYGYYGMISAARADFEDVIKQRNLNARWDEMENNFRRGLEIRPWIVANSSPDGLFASHLSTLGLYVLEVSRNMSQISDVLAN